MNEEKGEDDQLNVRAHLGEEWTKEQQAGETLGWVAPTIVNEDCRSVRMLRLLGQM